MIDPKIIRENPDLVRKSLEARQASVEDFENYIEKDEKWRKYLQEIENLTHELKKITPKGKPTDDEREVLKSMSDKISSGFSIAIIGKHQKPCRIALKIIYIFIKQI